MERKTVRIDDDGSVVIPAEFLDALGLKAGDAVIFTLEGDDLGMYTLRKAVKRIQESVRKHVPEGVSLADELIEERRAAAAAVEAVRAARKSREAAPE